MSLNRCKLKRPATCKGEIKSWGDHGSVTTATTSLPPQKKKTKKKKQPSKSFHPSKTPPYQTPSAPLNFFQLAPWDGPRLSPDQAKKSTQRLPLKKRSSLFQSKPSIFYRGIRVIKERVLGWNTYDDDDDDDDDDDE